MKEKRLKHALPLLGNKINFHLYIFLMFYSLVGLLATVFIISSNPDFAVQYTALLPIQHKLHQEGSVSMDILF